MKIYCIGIGGIGLSALARLYLSRGFEVSGSDRASTELIKSLEAEGVVFHEGHSPESLSPQIDLVVHSAAIPDSNPVLAKAKALGIRTLTYPQALGEVAKEYKKVVAISGTHGKTTTTAMLLHILKEVGLNPTGIVGSLLSDSGSNYVSGNKDLLVLEACEFNRSFLSYYPDLIGITNIDEDHLDYYKDLEEIKSAFRDFANNMPEDGVLICDGLDDPSWQAFESLLNEIIDYSLVKSDDIILQVPGNYNIRNAQLAVALALKLGVSESAAKEALMTFSGTWRRAQYKGQTKGGARIYDDYAHHPTELVNALEGFRDLFKDKVILAVFQPHLYSRTKKMLRQFSAAFPDNFVDQIYLLPIYAAREPEDKSISHHILAQEISTLRSGVVAVDSLDWLGQQLENLDDNNVIVTLGAGDVYQFGERLVQKDN